MPTGVSNFEGNGIKKRAMKHLCQILVAIVCAGWIPWASAAKPARSPLPDKIMQAKSAFIMCECPRDMVIADLRARMELLSWGRLDIVGRREEADLVVLISANEYLGDLLTRDGPDKRPIFIDFTILTLIDPATGESLWSDSRRWGSWRVDSATKDLFWELRDQVEAQTKRWTLNDVLMCTASPIFAGFARLTPDDARKKPSIDGSTVVANSDRLTLTSPTAPNFCRQTQLLVGADNRIFGFEVLASQSDRLDVNEILQQADQFEFTGGKRPNSEQIYFDAQSKDKKVLIQYEMLGHKSVLSRVRYFFSHEHEH